MYVHVRTYVQVLQKPPEKKVKLDDEEADNFTRSSAETTKTVGVATEEDVVLNITSSHLDLDDIPMELLPTHQEKIMKQV